MKKSYEIDMCNGPLLGKILRFSIPLMFSGILQLLFNAADIIVVGRFTSSDALAAVGSTTSLNNLIINLFLGLSIGSSVVVARYYGAQDWKKVGESVHTSILISALAGVALIFLGIALARPLLEAMGTPENVLDQAVLYMRIIFVGMPAMMVYNFGAAILRAVGDTRRPLIFLLISGIINVCLNLFFVIVFEMGVAGVSLATVISQFISAALVVICLVRSGSHYRLTLTGLRISKKVLLEILRVGLPAGIQSTVFNISNVLIQSSINSFGSIAVAGNTAAANLEGFVYTSMNAIYQASLSFTSQNVGARKTERIVPILVRCLACVVVIGVGLSTIVLLLNREFLGIYSSDPAVIEYGVGRLKVVCLTYFLCGIMDVTCGSIRGLGYSVTPTIVSLIGACGLRIVWIYTIFNLVDRSLFTLYLSYPVTWIITFAAHLICFIVYFQRWKQKDARWKAGHALPTAAESVHPAASKV
ncbi:MAG TPA: MATE family efflux transporter [Candidatus Onthovicinus excrementipullorum]|nr:MATE family efflux transporter [Candidatus Onthovicinus excrementipullorum]